MSASLLTHCLILFQVNLRIYQSISSLENLVISNKEKGRTFQGTVGRETGQIESRSSYHF